MKRLPTLLAAVVLTAAFLSPTSAHADGGVVAPPGAGAFSHDERPSARSFAAVDAALAEGCPGPLTADYRLPSDLTCGLHAVASGITIDLGGHVLTGPIVGDVDGAGQVDGVTVRNGTIRGPRADVILGSDALLENLRVEGGEGFVVQIGSGRVHNSLFVDNDVPVDLYWGRNITVTDSTFIGNRFGVNIASDNESVIRNNDFIDNTVGVRIYDEESFGSSDNLVTGNRFLGNDTGMVLAMSNEATGNQVSDNLFRNNRLGGLVATLGCERYETDTCGGDGTRIEGNRFDWNGAGLPGGDGLEVGGEADALAGVTVAGNTVVQNGGLGIDAAGVTDGGSNWASANGDPRQCVGVRCSPK